LNDPSSFLSVSERFNIERSIALERIGENVHGRSLSHFKIERITVRKRPFEIFKTFYRSKVLASDKILIFSKKRQIFIYYKLIQNYAYF